jgi:epsilon-lactone hydrolase
MRSLQASLLVLALRLMRRRRIYASAEALYASTAKIRLTGPAHPCARMRRKLDIADTQIDGQQIYTLTPRNGATSGEHILYFHGGAYFRPITRHHWRFLAALAERTGCTITVPYYPLAPEHQCAETIDFALRVMAWVMHEAPADHVTLMGDSAGGGLVTALALALRDRGLAPPRQLILLTPWLDVSASDPRMSANAARDPMLALAGAREAGRRYAGKLGVEHPLASPLMADLTGLPPITLFAATHDLLLQDALRFARKARSQGCEVDLRVQKGMIHVWPIMPIPEARRTRAAIAALLATPRAHIEVSSKRCAHRWRLL